MSHVDDGSLHAYLDGALDEYPAAEASRVRQHLETCSVCLGRLEEQRRVRADAAAVLGLAAPNVEVPTFEELRAYVRASEPGRTTVSVRIHRMGWAASVALALGTGWMLRGGQIPTTPRFEAVRGADGAAESEQAAGAGFNERDARVQERPAERQLEVAEARTAVTGGIAELATPDVAAEAEAPVTAPPETSAFADASDRDETRAAATQEVGVDLVATGVLPPSSANVLDEPGVMVGRGLVAAPALPLADAPADGAPVMEKVDDQKVAERLDTAGSDVEAARRSAPEPVLASALSAEPGRLAGARARATQDEETSDDELLSLVVPGLRVVEVVLLGQGTAYAGTRAVQILESGDTLEMFDLPEGVEPSTLPPLLEGHSELVVQRGLGWLVMRAAVPEASLLALLQRLESGN